MIIYLILQQLQNIFSEHHNPCFHLWRIVDVIDDFPYFASQSSKVGQSENGIFSLLRMSLLPFQFFYQSFIVVCLFVECILRWNKKNLLILPRVSLGEI